MRQYGMNGCDVRFVVHFEKAWRKTMKETDIAGILTSTRTIALVGQAINPIAQAIG
jgi:hypothetical protein